MKSCVFYHKNGDISLEVDGMCYEYDTSTNRYYFLDDGTEIKNQASNLALRRISKDSFHEKLDIALENNECVIGGEKILK